MKLVTTEALRFSYRQAMGYSNALTDVISTDLFSRTIDPATWMLGPFEKDASLTFRQRVGWVGPTVVGSTSGSTFNPSLIEEDGKLYLVYRASPQKESTTSRIGMAFYDTDNSWQDNPIIFPTQANAVFGCEDPKEYAANGSCFLFYNGIWSMSGTAEATELATTGFEVGPVGCDVSVAVSEDLIRWERLGLAVPHEISHLWAKGAVVPRNGGGAAAKAGDEYLNFLPEGCGGKTFVGHSPNMMSWTFREQEYLDLGELGGTPYEVACATVPDDDTMIIDLFYSDRNGDFAAAHALYSIGDPFTQTELGMSGSLAWGGLLRPQGNWMFAQVWDAPAHTREIYFYRSRPASGDLDTDTPTAQGDLPS
jgi:hypothetical protein